MPVVEGVPNEPSLYTEWLVGWGPLSYPVELVVARAVVERAGRVLLVRRAGWDSYPRAWELPGGKAEPGELPELAVARELREETGLVAAGEPRPEFTCVVRSPSGRTVAECFFGVRAPGRPALSSEHDDYAWHDLASAPPAPLTPATAAWIRAARRTRACARADAGSRRRSRAA